MSCKGCKETVVIPDEDIQKLVNEAETDKTNMISEELYEARLRECNSCPSLLYGTTCAYCGCIVHYRAKFKHKSCPNTEKPRWEKVI